MAPNEALEKKSEAKGAEVDESRSEISENGGIPSEEADSDAGEGGGSAVPSEDENAADSTGGTPEDGEKAPSEDVAAVADAEADRRYRILVVEDNVIFAESFQILWQRMGHPVEVAHDGEEALEAARRFRPDVVFCDLRLPDSMDGYEVCRRLKAGGEPVPLVIALTGFAEDEVAEPAREAGFDDVAGKLRDAEELEEIVERLRRGKPGKYTMG